MMFLKRGFSLAELLLAVGIIGIITAMGMSITKHAADKAYQGYWYNGYITLYNIIGEFNNKQYFTDSASAHYINSKKTFVAQLNGILNGTKNGNVVTKNNISYEIASRDNINSNTDVLYTITMTVPQPKTRQNKSGRNYATLYYIQNEGILIPSSKGDIDLQNRKDLLPAFFDTGIRNDNRIQTDSSREYLSYNKAYCNNHSSSYSIINNKGKNAPLIKCSKVGSANNNGILRVMNPAKVR